MNVSSEKSHWRAMLIAWGTRLLFVLAIGVAMIAAYLVANGFPRSVRMFPQAVAVAGVVVVALNLLAIGLFAFGRRRPPDTSDGAGGGTADIGSDTSLRAILPWLGWIAGTYAAAWLIGFIAAATLFSLAFLKWPARQGFLTTIVLTSLCIGVTLLLGKGLNISWPQGIVYRYFD